jgi:hypothetical protein
MKRTEKVGLKVAGYERLKEVFGDYLPILEDIPSFYEEIPSFCETCQDRRDGHHIECFKVFPVESESPDGGKDWESDVERIEVKYCPTCGRKLEERDVLQG